ncbi:hypothetical protein CR513_45325, partial [Mucuna pruriens]
MGHPSFRCWKRPNTKCSKCNQLVYEAVICRSKFQQHEVNAQVVKQNEEDYIFAATCFSIGRTIAISTSLGTKIISYVLYVPDIDQNLLSVGQLIEKEFKVSFEHQHCLIYDIAG